MQSEASEEPCCAHPNRISLARALCLCLEESVTSIPDGHRR